MADIIDLYRDFKSEAEKNSFLQAQYNTINQLSQLLKEKEQEVSHLKQLLISTNDLKEREVTKIIVTPEEALLDTQINLIQERSLNQELSLEDVKKLDLLLKNKILLNKDEKGTFPGNSKKIPNIELLKIVQGSSDSKK